jgi:RNA polymerase sigma factor (sigma-70 family)
MATTQVGTFLQHIHKLAADRGVQHWTDRQLLDDFATGHSEAAFAALVARHGPMVLRVCRRVLSHEQDAEDAFQATFLVLAGNAGSIRNRDTVGDWLHGVAYRTALNTKRGTARRRSHEARLRAVAPQAASPLWDDVQAVLDEEILRLPPCFRKAFVLCVLEGKSGPEVAAELGCKEGTVKSRVNRARRLLQQQLARRGIQLAALLGTLAIAERAGRASLPHTLAQATVGFGLLVAVGEPAAAVIPPPVAQVAAGVTRAMFLTKAKIVTAALLALTLIATSACVLAHQALAAGRQSLESQGSAVSNSQPERAGAKAPAVDEKDSLAYAGRVLAPDGKAVPGATLYLTRWEGGLRHPSPSRMFATTGPDGGFQFTASKVEFGDHGQVVAATAPNYGVGWVEIPAGARRDNLTLRLVEDNVPITGQIVDLEGKPVPGATLRVLQINAATGEDLGPWLEAARRKKGLSLQLQSDYLRRFTIAVAPKVTTDAEGRFRLGGVGRNRLVTAQLSGPTIVTQWLHILTRTGRTIEVTEHEGNTAYGDPHTVITYYPASLRHVAAPTKPIMGVVRDKDTKKPLGGATIQSLTLATNPIRIEYLVQTTADAEGRYRLTGMPKGKGNKIMVVPPRGLPYVAVHAEVPDTPGLDPVTVDFEMKRGIWIEGKITDKVTGKPVRGAVEYFSLYSNRNLADYPGYDGTFLPDFGVGANEDGSYRVVGLPGPGLIAVWARKPYLRAPERGDEYGVKEPSLSTSPYHMTNPINYTALARIDPPKGVESVKRDVALDPGWTFTGTVLSPDGKPLAGVRCFGLTGERRWEHEPRKTAEFTVRGFNPSRPREVLFQHSGKGLVGVTQPPKANGGSVTVGLEPGASITGRLVDASGNPRAGIDLEVAFHLKGDSGFRSYSPERIKTDREGRFRVEALLPGYEFRLEGAKGELHLGALRSGQTKDLGDVRMKEKEE